PPFKWRGFWDFGTGALGDMACHIMDAAYWTLDLGYPSRIEAEPTPLFKETAPAGSRISYSFAAKGKRPEVKVVWRDGSLYPPRPAEVADELAWPFDNGGGQLAIGSAGELPAGPGAGDQPGERPGDEREQPGRVHPSALSVGVELVADVDSRPVARRRRPGRGAGSQPAPRPGHAVRRGPRHEPHAVHLPDDP